MASEGGWTGEFASFSTPLLKRDCVCTPLLAGAEGAGEKFGFNCVHPSTFKLHHPIPGHSLMRPPPIEHIT